MFDQAQQTTPAHNMSPEEIAAIFALTEEDFERIEAEMAANRSSQAH